MTTQYPAKIDNNTSLPDAIDNITPVKADVVNRLKQAILAVENELGTKPSGVSATVKARLSDIENSINNLEIVQLTNDLGGTIDEPLVVGLRGIPISSSLPAIGQTLSFNGLAWVPVDPTIASFSAVQREIFIIASDQSTKLSTFTRVGGRKIDFTLYPATVGGLSRQVKFIVDVQKTSGATSVEIELFDITHAVQVTSTNIIYSTDNALTEISTGSLTVGSSAGNLRSDTTALYEIHIKMNGGTGSDAVFITNARLQISYV